MASLGVNIDHIANVRQARRHRGARSRELRPVWPSWAAPMASPCTCAKTQPPYSREDRDVELLRQVVRSRLDLEMAATPEIKGDRPVHQARHGHPGASRSAKR